jgi:hypothetical protein
MTGNMRKLQLSEMQITETNGVGTVALWQPIWILLLHKLAEYDPKGNKK